MEAKEVTPENIKRNNSTPVDEFIEAWVLGLYKERAENVKARLEENPQKFLECVCKDATFPLGGHININTRHSLLLKLITTTITMARKERNNNK